MSATVIARASKIAIGSGPSSGVRETAGATSARVTTIGATIAAATRTAERR
jgi:hypothetical protein